MQLTVKIEGLDQIGNATKEVRAIVAKEIQGALKVSGERVRGEALKSILQGGKTGRIYNRGNVAHTASAPGEAPANDTGRLASSIVSIQDKDQVLIIAGTGSVKYATMLEFGTTNIKPRPFMLPALEKSRQWIIDRLNRAVVDGAAKSVKR